MKNEDALKEAKRAYERAWYQTHKEYFRARYLANREEILKKQRERYAALSKEERSELYLKRIERELRKNKRT